MTRALSSRPSGRTVEERGRLDIVVNNAGGPPPGTFESTPAEAWAEAFELSLNSAVRLTRLALPHLKQSGRGRIINITSWSVREPIPNLMLSNAIRPGVVGWAKTLAQEVGREGITVNTIAPGKIDTPRVRELWSHHPDPEAAAKRDIEAIPVGRLGSPRGGGRAGRLPLLTARGVRHRSGAADRRRRAAGNLVAICGSVQLGSMATCYRHPDRETDVSCSNCGRPICPDCMRQTPVGVRCPECAGQRTRSQLPAFLMGNEPRLTYGLIAANVVLFLATNNINGGGGGGGLFGSGGQLNSLGLHLALWGPAVHHGAVLPAGQLRLHPLRAAAPRVQHVRAVPAGQLAGALRRQPPLRPDLPALGAGRQLRRPAAVTPNSLTAGASGAIFGLMGAMLVLERHRGVAAAGRIDRRPAGRQPDVHVRLSGSISVGGHIGGLIGGVLTGVVLSGYGRGHLAHGRLTPSVALGLMLIATGTIAGSLAVAGG